MNTIGEMKDVYTIARHVGIPGDKIDKFLRTAEMAGYILVKKESADAASKPSNEEKA